MKQNANLWCLVFRVLVIDHLNVVKKNQERYFRVLGWTCVLHDLRAKISVYMIKMNLQSLWVKLARPVLTRTKI